MPQSAQLKFVKTVPSLTNEKQTMGCPFAGIINQITIACPAGPNYAVELRITRNGDPIFPTDGGYATFDSTTISFPLNELAKRGDIIMTEWINHGNYSHTIPVIVSIISTKVEEVHL